MNNMKLHPHKHMICKKYPFLSFAQQNHSIIYLFFDSNPQNPHSHIPCNKLIINQQSSFNLAWANYLEIQPKLHEHKKSHKTPINTLT